MSERKVNLIPFDAFFIGNGKMDISQIILNVLIFIPLGIYVGIIFKKYSWGKYLFCFFSTSLLIEALQFIMKIGAFDITDIITNTCGGISGLIMLKMLERLCKSETKAQKIINITAGIGTSLILLFLILLKLNMLWIRYQ